MHRRLVGPYRDKSPSRLALVHTRYTHSPRPQPVLVFVLRFSSLRHLSCTSPHADSSPPPPCRDSLVARSLRPDPLAARPPRVRLPPPYLYTHHARTQRSALRARRCMLYARSRSVRASADLLTRGAAWPAACLARTQAMSHVPPYSLYSVAIPCVRHCVAPPSTQRPATGTSHAPAPARRPDRTVIAPQSICLSYVSITGDHPSGRTAHHASRVAASISIATAPFSLSSIRHQRPPAPRHTRQ